MQFQKLFASRPPDVISSFTSEQETVGFEISVYLRKGSLFLKVIINHLIHNNYADFAVISSFFKNQPTRLQD